MASTTGLATALGVPKSRISEWKTRGMPTHSVEAARTWREIHAPARQRRISSVRAKSNHPAASPEELVPAKKRRHSISDTDDQGERDGDQPSNPYDALRRAKQAEEVAWHQIEKIQRHGGLMDATEFAGLMRTFAAAQKHTALMQQKAEEWSRRMGVTLYADEAISIYGASMQTILQQVDLMAAKISPLCVDPERARDAIEDYAQKLRLAAQEAIEANAQDIRS